MFACLRIRMSRKTRVTPLAPGKGRGDGGEGSGILNMAFLSEIECLDVARAFQPEHPSHAILSCREKGVFEYEYEYRPPGRTEYEYERTVFNANEHQSNVQCSSGFPARAPDCEALSRRMFSSTSTKGCRSTDHERESPLLCSSGFPARAPDSQRLIAPEHGCRQE